MKEALFALFQPPHINHRRYHQQSQSLWNRANFASFSGKYQCLMTGGLQISLLKCCQWNVGQRGLGIKKCCVFGSTSCTVLLSFIHLMREEVTFMWCSPWCTLCAGTRRQSRLPGIYAKMFFDRRTRRERKHSEHWMNNFSLTWPAANCELYWWKKNNSLISFIYLCCAAKICRHRLCISSRHTQQWQGLNANAWMNFPILDLTCTNTGGWQSSSLIKYTRILKSGKCSTSHQAEKNNI